MSTGNPYSRVQGLDWVHLFAEKNLAGYLEELREEWKKEFDFILVDSRTGITDVGGICTIYLPDALILMFTTNTQSLNGVIDVLERARNARDRLPFDRSRLVGIPVPARDETRAQYQEAMEWRRTFARELDELYQDWLPRNMTSADALELLRIPYVAYWSFGERLPVVEEGTTDPTSLGFAYGVFAKLLADRFQWDRDSTDSIEIIEGQQRRADLYSVELQSWEQERREQERWEQQFREQQLRTRYIRSMATIVVAIAAITVAVFLLIRANSLYTSAPVNVSVVRMIDPSNEQQIFPEEPEYQLSPNKEVRIQIDPAGNNELRWWIEPIDFGRFYTVTTGSDIVFISPTETDRQGVVSVCEPDPSANFVCKEDSIRQIQIRTISK